MSARYIVVMEIPESAIPAMADGSTVEEWKAELAEFAVEAKEHGGTLMLVEDPRRCAAIMRAARGR